MSLRYSGETGAVFDFGFLTPHHFPVLIKRWRTLVHTMNAFTVFPLISYPVSAIQADGAEPLQR